MKNFELKITSEPKTLEELAEATREAFVNAVLNDPKLFDDFVCLLEYRGEIIADLMEGDLSVYLECVDNAEDLSEIQDNPTYAVYEDKGWHKGWRAYHEISEFHPFIEAKLNEYSDCVRKLALVKFDIDALESDTIGELEDGCLDEWNWESLKNIAEKL